MSWIVAWFVKKFGERLGLPVLIGTVVILLFVLLALGRCVAGDSKADQVEQAHKATQAVTEAAADAVQKVSERTNAETAIDAATATAKEEIGNAQNTDDIRRAVVSALCVRAEYKHDPACSVQRVNSR